MSLDDDKKQNWKGLSAAAALLALPFAVSACHPWLSSQGETHSPYDPAKVKAATPKVVAAPAAAKPAASAIPAPKPLPKPSASPSSSPSPTSAHPDARKSLELTDDQALSIVFNESFVIPTDVSGAQDFGPDNCRELRLQAGQFLSQPDDVHFSCSVHYCIFKPGRNDETRMQLTVPQGTTISFKKIESSVDSNQVEHLAFQWSGGGSRKSGGTIDQLNCDNYRGISTVEDLIDAFGPGQKQDVTDIRVVSQPQRGPSSTSTYRPPTESVQDWTYARPTVGLQLTGSTAALGGATISPAQQGVTSSAFLIQLEYQPRFLQSFGVFSIGPSLGVYPTTGRTASGQTVTSNATSLLEYGAQARYQFRYFHNQFVVPYASYEVQSLGYDIKDGGSGRLNIAGGSAGLAFLINDLAPGDARQFYDDVGILRTYVVLEGKSLWGSDINVSVGGTSFYFGLRFEH